MAIYSSEYFPSNVKAEEFYREDYGYIKSSTVGSKFRYLNEQYKKMIQNSKRGNVSNYKIFTEYGRLAERLNRDITRRIAREKGDVISNEDELNVALQKYGFIKNINHNTGEIEFKTSGYGEYSQEERIKMLGIRDAMLNNWAMSEEKWNLYKEEIREKGRSSFFDKYPSMSKDVFERLNFIFDSPEWSRIRRKVKYDEGLIENVIQSVEKNLSNKSLDVEDIERLLNSSDSVIDFLNSL